MSWYKWPFQFECDKWWCNFCNVRSKKFRNTVLKYFICRLLETSQFYYDFKCCSKKPWVSAESSYPVWFTTLSRDNLATSWKLIIKSSISHCRMASLLSWFVSQSFTQCQNWIMPAVFLHWTFMKEYQIMIAFKLLFFSWLAGKVWKYRSVALF